MSDWIKLRAAGIRAAEQGKKDERDRQIVAANALKAKAEPFWNSLMTVLQDCVKEFNAEFPEPERRIEHIEKPSPTAVTIRRNVYPGVLVRAQLNGSSTAVHYTITRTPRKGSEPVEKSGNFVFGVKDGQVAYTEGEVNEHEDVAKLFLDPFFDFQVS
jgi:hypothetical protein